MINLKIPVMSVNFVTSSDEGGHSLLYAASEEVKVGVKMRDTGGGGNEFIYVYIYKYIYIFIVCVFVIFFFYD